MSKYVAVTGAAGFIGREVTRKLLDQGHYVYAVDALTYAAEPSFLTNMLARHPARFTFVVRDLNDRQFDKLPDVDAIIHLAAETHVDNSISDGERFTRVNVMGTFRLLEMCRGMRAYEMPHFIHISTDEVYGPCPGRAAKEYDAFAPSPPYAASKAAADLMVQAWGTTYGLRSTILRPTNVYGPGQYPEKLIPKTVRSFMLGRKMTIHGDGAAVRCWLSVSDLADAIIRVLENESPVGEMPVLNVGGNTEASVKQVVARIAQIMGRPCETESVAFGYTRQGIDQRYAVDDTLLRTAGWSPSGNFWNDLPALVEGERTRFRF